MVRCEIRVMRRIFEPKRDENVEWRRLHYEHHSLYRLPNVFRVIKSRRSRWAGHIVRMEQCRRAFKILSGKLTGKLPLGRPRCKWKGNIRKDLKEIGWQGIGLILPRVRNIGEL